MPKILNFKCAKVGKSMIFMIHEDMYYLGFMTYDSFAGLQYRLYF